MLRTAWEGGQAAPKLPRQRPLPPERTEPICHLNQSLHLEPGSTLAFRDDLTLDKGMEDSHGEIILSTPGGQKALSGGLAQKGGFSDSSETGPQPGDSAKDTES